MGLAEDIKFLDKQLASQKTKDWIHHNQILLDIHEGNLLEHIDKDLREQLTDRAYLSAKTRIPPINVLRKIIDKLSQVYAQTPVRVVHNQDGKEADPKDQDILQWYVDQFAMEERAFQANEYFNLNKVFAYEPFVQDGNPSLRVIPGDRFYVYSNDAVNPLRMTHFVKIMGKALGPDGKDKTLFYAYTDQEILPFWEGGDIATDVMAAKDLDGKNPYGKIPFVYCARSKIDLIPRIDSDTLAMTKLIPVLLADLNYAVMYQSFGIIYTIDAAIEGTRAPNAIWTITSDPANPKTPTIGTIKPEVDIDQVTALIKTELSMWMESRNIKPGSMGDLKVDGAASGIAKAIEEMDTSVDRKKQVPFLKRADEALFDLVLNYLHPVWMKQQGFEKPVMPSAGIMVKASFAEQRPLIDSTQALADQKTAIDMGIQSRRGALEEIYPDWSDDQIDARLKEVEEEKKKQADATPPNQPQDANGITTGKEPAANTQPKAETAKAAG